MQHQLIKAVFLTTILLSGLASIHADVEILTPEQLIEYIDNQTDDKPVVVSLSSTNKGCIHCIPHNEKVIKAEETLSSDYNFVQVNFDPWQSISKSTDLHKRYKKENLFTKGLPHTAIFYKGRGFYQKAGNVNYFNERLIGAKNLLEIHDTEEYDAKALPVVKADELDAFIENRKGTDRFLVVHLTSTDGSSPHTKRSNAYMRLAQKRFGKEMDFVEVHFNPWNTIKELKNVAKFNKHARGQVNGIPYDYLITTDGKAYGLGGTTPMTGDTLKRVLDSEKKKKKKAE